MKLFDLPYLERELRRLDASLTEDAVLHVIGGGAMAFHDRKPGTKDIDVVLMHQAEADAVLAALQRAGYAAPPALDPAYLRMGARRVVENRDGFRWDVFVRSVLGFELSPRMAARSRPWLALPRLRVLVAAPEDIFTFKALTDRPRDRGDMNDLFLGGLDTAVIREEVLEQAKRPGGRRFAVFFQAGLEEFAAEYGVVYPDAEEFERLAFVERLAVALGERLQRGAMERDELRGAQDNHEATDAEFDEALTKLVAWGAAERAGDGLRPRTAPPDRA